MVGPERGEMDCRERRDEINAEEEESSRVRYDVDEVVACWVATVEGLITPSVMAVHIRSASVEPSGTVSSPPPV